jgi:type VI secretion system protein ImpG
MSNKDFLSYYKNEINLLRNIGKEYAEKQPLLASYLSETSKDPDSERLIEAIAFLNANLKQELDSSSNILINELIDIVYPDFTKPKPCISIIEFTPFDNLDEKISIKKFSYIKAKNTQKINCKFRTSWDINMYPIKIQKLKYYDNISNNSSQLEISLFSSKAINTLELNEIDFFINMSLPNSLVLSKMLMHNLIDIEFCYNDKKVYLKKDKLTNLGFDNENNIFSYNKKTPDNFKVLNEYFSFSRKSLFFRLIDLKKETENIYTNNLVLKFNFNTIESNFLSIKSELNNDDIKLFCVPIINAFKFDLEPIKVNYLNETMKIVSSYSEEDKYLLYELNTVKGLKKTDQKNKLYKPFNNFDDDGYSYKFFRKKVLGDSKKDTNYLQLFYKNNEYIDDIITINADVTNGSLCEYIKIGDISLDTENSPEYCKFSNIIIPSTYVESPIDNKNLSFLLSHISTNILGIKDINILKDLLKFYISYYSSDKENNIINIKKVNSLKKFYVKNISKLERGIFISGNRIYISSDSSYFIHIEDLYLFGNLLFMFFKSNILLNTYLELVIDDIYTGERFFYNE